MSDVTVSPTKAGNKWSVTDENLLKEVIRTKRKKIALKKAKGIAQDIADSRGRTATINVFTSKSEYQRTIRVEPV